jgi:hypothetical protein
MLWKMYLKIQELTVMSSVRPATKRQRLYIFNLLQQIGTSLYEWCGYHYDSITFSQAEKIIPILKEDRNLLRNNRI